MANFSKLKFLKLKEIQKTISLNHSKHSTKMLQVMRNSISRLCNTKFKKVFNVKPTLKKVYNVKNLHLKLKIREANVVPNA